MIHQQIDEQYLGEKREFISSDINNEQERHEYINEKNHLVHDIFHKKIEFQQNHDIPNQDIDKDDEDVLDYYGSNNSNHSQQNSYETNTSKSDQEQLINEINDYKVDHQIDVENIGALRSKQQSQHCEDQQKSINKAGLLTPNTSSRCQYLNQNDIKLLSFLVFCINYGYSIEMVFISPFFFKVNTPDVLGTLIWLIPPILEKMLFPIISIPLKKRSISMLKYRKLFILLFSALSIAGLFLMGFSRYITANWITVFDDKKTSIMFLGIFGFVFQDIGHDMILLIVNQYTIDSIKQEDEDQCEYQFAFANSSGKICAFLISSVLAFNIEVWDVQNFMENLTFSYCIGAILLFIGFLYSFKGLRTNQMKITQIYPQEQIVPVYNIDTVLPSFAEIKNMARQQKFLVISHFLMCSNLVLINIYATLWMGQTLQSSSQKYNVEYNKMINYLFDLGISWGALILCIASFLYFFSNRYIQTLRSIRSNKLFLFASNFALNLSFIYTYYTENFYSSCLSLLLWGVAQSSFDSIPAKLCQYLEKQQKISNKVSSELLDISSFFCQIFFWFIMPAIFLLFSEFDDISFSLLQGSIFGLIGSILVLYIH